MTELATCAGPADGYPSNMRNRQVQLLAGVVLALWNLVAGGADVASTGPMPRVYTAFETRIITSVAYVDRVPVRYVSTVVTDPSGLRSTNRQLAALSEPLRGWVIVAPTLENCEALPVRQLLDQAEVPARAAAARRAQARQERIQRQPASFPAYRRVAPAAGVPSAVIVASSPSVPPVGRYSRTPVVIPTVRSVSSLSSTVPCGPVG